MSRPCSVLLALAAALLLAAPACGDSDDGDFWGPLAVSEFAGGDQALVSGTLRLTSGCAHLDESGDPVLLVWPVDRIMWNGETITFTTSTGDRVELGDGDHVTLAGGGSSVDEGGPAGVEFLQSVEWIAVPDPTCPLDVRWFVSDVAGAG